MPENEFFSIHTSLLLEECILLKKVLTGLVEENLYLKNKLSENLQKGFSGTHLEKFEHIQNQLIQNDHFFNALGKDTHELEVLLQRNLSEDQFVHKVLRDKVHGLKHKIIEGESSLTGLKRDFDACFQ